MTIWISREHPLCNSERVDVLCAWFGQPCEKIRPLEFLESFRCSISSVSLYYVPESDICVKSSDHLNFSRASVVHFRVRRYVMHLNRTTVWKDMTNWISRELPLFNFERLGILWAWTGHLSEMSWPYEFPKCFPYSISSTLIYYTAVSNIQLKRYDHSDFWRASIVQFRASRYIMRLNRTSVWNVMTMWISRELPLFSFKRLDMLCT